MNDSCLTDQVGQYVVVYFNREVAARALKMSIQRLGFLLRQGRLEGAIQINERGDWRIPAKAVAEFTRLRAGRPFKKRDA